ncbi:hypothetical protein L6164_009715 [Bauhinia variegata]|uniref:Uncharacterized protein n=2 Tax=Bauhinia variegata TaxID=167791 RepID=A0ACB9PM96_BAUVA|nr:hypothetical protein L6164_009715 [Bauhinia variegata]
MAPGHLLPMVDVAKLLGRHPNVKVTIITTPLNAVRFRATVDREIQSGSLIQVLQVQFPHAECGIPEGCESLDTLSSMDHQVKFFTAVSKLQQAVEELFRELKPSPSCMVCDKYIPWLAETANKFRIPRIIFDGTNCFNLLCNHNLRVSKVFESVSDYELLVVPGMPHKIEFSKSQLPGPFNPATNPEFFAFLDQVRVAEKEAYGIVVNSFEELEPEYAKECRRVTGHKIWCIGPVSLLNKDNLDKAQRGKRDSSHDASQYLKWLDSWPPSSVIYVCLGSLNRVTPEQLIELGLGLELTNRPFMWVIKARGSYRKEETEKLLLENGFEERVKGRGVLIRDWAPQLLILSHRAIGAFLTHCGWNSTLEGICAGVPLITFPLFAEQFYNEKVVLQILETGVKVGGEKVQYIGQEEKNGVQVKKENVKEAIEKVMGQGEEKEKRRARARHYAKMAEKAIEKGGSSYHNMSVLIEDIKQKLNHS